MANKEDNLKVIDCKASDNVYMHKSFHGALCAGIKYLDDKYGEEATVEYLKQVGRTYFRPLSEQLKTKGLEALETHWRKTFSAEEGDFSLRYDDDTLVLEVNECPAVSYLKANNALKTNRYCETTVVVNETICQAAGYECSCDYQPGEGKCIQKFWKKKE